MIRTSSTNYILQKKIACIKYYIWYHYAEVEAEAEAKADADTKAETKAKTEAEDKVEA